MQTIGLQLNANHGLTSLKTNTRTCSACSDCCTQRTASSNDSNGRKFSSAEGRELCSAPAVGSERSENTESQSSLATDTRILRAWAAPRSWLVVALKRATLALCCCCVTVECCSSWSATSPSYPSPAAHKALARTSDTGTD